MFPLASVGSLAKQRYNDTTLRHVDISHVLVAIGLAAIFECAAMNREHDRSILEVKVPIDIQNIPLMLAIRNILVDLDLCMKIRCKQPQTNGNNSFGHQHLHD